MRIEFLYWDGCPSHPRALSDLREALREVGLDPDSVAVSEIRTEQQAHAQGFFGSPTIRIDGAEVQPPGEGEPTGLACRVYRRRDGRISPTPDPAELRDALRAALAARAAA